MGRRREYGVAPPGEFAELGHYGNAPDHWGLAMQTGTPRKSIIETFPNGTVMETFIDTIDDLHQAARDDLDDIGDYGTASGFDEEAEAKAEVETAAGSPAPAVPPPPPAPSYGLTPPPWKRPLDPETDPSRFADYPMPGHEPKPN